MFGVQEKRARREKKLNLEREKLNLWGGRPDDREARQSSIEVS